MSALGWLGAALCSLCLSPTHSTAGGGVAGHITSVANADAAASDFIYGTAADATAQIAVRVDTDFTGPGAVYRHVARLLDPSGAPVTLVNPANPGSPGARAEFGQFTTSAAGSRPSSYNLRLGPGVQLDPYALYRVEVSLEYLGAGVPVSEGGAMTAPPRRHIHFTNTGGPDGPSHVITELVDVAWHQTATVDNPAGVTHWLEADVHYLLYRYDELARPGPQTDTIRVHFDVRLRTSHGGIVSARLDSNVEEVPVASFTEGSPRTPWSSPLRTARLRFQPASHFPVVSESTATASVGVSHEDVPGSPTLTGGNTKDSPSTAILHFNGRLLWGATETTLSDFGNDPTVDLRRSATDVQTSLQNAVGGLRDVPGASLFTSAPIQVSIDDAGTTRVLSGSGRLAMPDTDRILGRIRYRHVNPIQLDTSGAKSTIRLQLPAGMGVGRPGYALRSRLTTASPGNLTVALDPQGVLTFGLAAEDRVAFDQRPLFFEAPSLTWNTSAGVISFNPASAAYVRRDAFAALSAATDLPPLQTEKPSNERYYEAADVGGSPFSVRVTPAGRTALSGVLDFGPGEFTSHFPLGVRFTWTGGTLAWVDDRPVVADSWLELGEIPRVDYEQGCPSGGCPSHPEGILTSARRLYFTEDGGLVGQGVAVAPEGGSPVLHWGWNEGRSIAAHEAGPFTNSAIAMAGHVLLRGSGATEENGPAHMLNSGSDPREGPGTNSIVMIRPGTPAYDAGVGDYAGINLYPAAQPPGWHVHGVARLGDSLDPVTFIPSARSKYYARLAGVSGLHEAEPGSFAPSLLTIYDYRIELGSFSLSFEANLNKHSGTRAEIHLPYPSDIQVSMQELTFTCVGAPDRATVADRSSHPTLAYWSAPIEVMGVVFTPQNHLASSCDASQREFLGLPLRMEPANVKEKLTGTVYFKPSGKIIRPADDLKPEAVPFSLSGPSSITLVGGKRTAHEDLENYSLILGKAYFSDAVGDPASLDEPDGWFNLFGQLHLPFYGDNQVHVMTLFRNPVTAWDPTDMGPPYFITAGWIEDGRPTFDAEGDPTHRGKPLGRPWKTSESSPPVVGYREDIGFAPHVRGDFLDVINLDFDLQWFPSLRSFAGVRPIDTSILILNSHRELHRLSAEDIAVEFGTAYEGFPRFHLTLQELGLVDTFEDLTGTMGSAFLPPLTEDARSGFISLRTLAGGQLRSTMVGGISVLATLGAAGLRDGLMTACPGDRPCDATADALLDGVFSSLRLDGPTLLAGETLAEATLRAALVRQLATVSTSLRSLWSGDDALFHRGSDGGAVRLDRLIHEILIRGLHFDPSLASHFEGDPELLKPFEGDLRRLEQVMLHLADRIDEMRARYASDSADLYLDLRALFADPAAAVELSGVAAATKAALRSRLEDPRWVAEHVAGPGDDLQAFLVNELSVRVLGTEFFHRVDHTLLFQLRAIEEEGLSSVDDVVALLQRMINTVGREALAFADQTLDNILIDSWDGALGFGNAQGYVFFSGDEILRLRLNGEGGVDFGKGNSFKCSVKFEVNSLDSEGSPSCATSTTVKATECRLDFSLDESRDRTIPAHTLDPRYDDDVPDPAGPDPGIPAERSETFAVWIKATFGDGFTADGFGGGFTWATKKNFGAVQGAKITGSCMFSRQEKYIAGSLEAHFGGDGGAELQGGLFLGRTCDLEPLRQLNPDVGRLLGGTDRPFTGFYVFAEGWIPVAAVAPPCLLSLSVGAGVGVLADFESDRYGGSIFGGVRGELLCVLSATGEIILTGLGGSEGFVFDGTGRLKAKLGVCPFCLKFTKEIGATYRDRTDSWTFRL
ncbi:MAG: hypothetical protein HYR88_00240 [Verrucomicrobia bacterium]|nr:hypothetical protein [Verrucomicrobiota bacterium]